MNFLRNYSIKAQIIIIILIVNFITVTIITAFTILSNIQAAKRNLISNSVVFANLFGEYTVIPFVFDDKERATENLQKASKNPEILNIRVFKGKEMFAGYDKNHEVFEMPEKINSQTSVFSANYLHIYQPIFYKNVEQGSIYMRFSTVNLKRLTRNNILVGVALLVVVLVVSLLMAMRFQRFISQPILRLAKISEGISQSENYSIDLSYKSRDEIGTLYKSFENMMRRIATRQMERDKAIEELSSSEDRFKTISSAAHNGIVVLDKTGLVTFWNQSASGIFGYKADEIKGTNLLTKVILPISSEESKRIEIIHFIEKPQPLQSGKSFETKAITKTGEKIEIELSLSASKIENREIVIAIIKDITSRKNYENNLKKAKEQAEESARLKTAFMANVSHEIRTPMNAIVGFTDLLRSAEVPEPQRIEFINIIHRNSQFLIRMLDNILNLAELQSGKIDFSIKEFNPNAILEDLYYDFERDREESGKRFIVIEKKIPENSNELKVKTDEYRLKQVMLNLLDNALKFTERGSIEFGYKIKRINKIPEVVFFVEDTGIGISSGEQAIIFDSFRQVDNTSRRKFGGCGLGLTISQEIVNLLGGKLWVESEIGKGSIFYVSIPNSGIPENMISDSQKQLADVQTKEIKDWSHLTILVAEDEESNTRFLSEVLKKTKVRLLTAENGEKAVEIFRNEPSINLVLMDLQMPIMDGYEATRLMREINPKIPIIAQTAFAMYNEQKRSKEAGCDDFITKPLRIKELYRVVEKYTEGLKTNA